MCGSEIRICHGRLVEHGVGNEEEKTDVSITDIEWHGWYPRSNFGPSKRIDGSIDIPISYYEFEEDKSQESHWSW